MLSKVKRLSDSPHALCEDPTHALALYYLCCAVTLHPATAAAVASADASSSLLRILAAARGGDALMRAQRGTMECISRTLCALSSEADKAGGAIDSATGDGGGDDGDSGDSDGGTISAAACAASCSALAARVCNLLDITATSMQAVAVVSTAVRMLHTRGGAPHAAPLARVLLPMLLGHEGAVVTQCLFDVTFHAQPLLPQPLLRRLLERARTDATSESDDTRLGVLMRRRPSEASRSSWRPRPLAGTKRVGDDGASGLVCGKIVLNLSKAFTYCCLYHTGNRARGALRIELSNRRRPKPENAPKR